VSEQMKDQTDKNPISSSYGYGVRIRRYAHSIEIHVCDAEDLQTYFGALEMILAEMNARMIRTMNAASAGGGAAE